MRYDTENLHGVPAPSGLCCPLGQFSASFHVGAPFKFLVVVSNLYIRIMTGFYTHRKTVKLRIRFGKDAYWIVPRLWAYAAENQPDGDMSKYSSEELAELLGCSSNASVMLQALKECGFIDENGFIHDWDFHNGYHERYSARAKKAAEARWSKKEKSPMPPKEIQDSGKRTVDSGDKHCSSNATSIDKHSEIYSPDSRVALHWLNEKSGRHFRESETSLSVIQARLDEKGVDIEGVKKMIDRQCLRWQGTPQEEYLRPETLFGKTKFDSYYAAKDLPITTQDKTEKPDYQKGF